MATEVKDSPDKTLIQRLAEIRPRRGGKTHRTYSVAVFITLASLDNVALGLVPPLYKHIADDLSVRQSAVGWVTAASFLISAIASVCWAYAGDRGKRKPLLMIGTVIWSLGTACTAVVETYPLFFAAQMVAAVGLGAVGSVGFSVVSDLVTPRRRGLVMGLWGLSQGVGTLMGTLLGGIIGARDWREPFWIITVLGLVATAAYIFTYDIYRGQSEPELAHIFRAGGNYEYRISASDIPLIIGHRTNIWLVLQGLAAQITFGSLVWLPQLFRARAEAQGYSTETATMVGGIYAALFQLGGILSIVGGVVGDRFQRRNPRGRARVAMVGILGGIPLYLVLFIFPFSMSLPKDAGAARVAGAAIENIFTDPAAGISFLTAMLALGLTSANAPNWFALVSDVNLPEHRGSVFSVINLVNGCGRAFGNGFSGIVFRFLERGLTSSSSYAVGLALFQVFFIPAAGAFYYASRTSPRDIADVTHTLRCRAGLREEHEKM